MTQTRWRLADGDGFGRLPVSSAIAARCDYENEPHDEHHGCRAATEVDQSQPLHAFVLPRSTLHT